MLGCVKSSAWGHLTIPRCLLLVPTCTRNYLPGHSRQTLRCVGGFPMPMGFSRKLGGSPATPHPPHRLSSRKDAGYQSYTPAKVPGLWEDFREGRKDAATPILSTGAQNKGEPARPLGLFPPYPTRIGRGARDHAKSLAVPVLSLHAQRHSH